MKKNIVTGIMSAIILLTSNGCSCEMDKNKKEVVTNSGLKYIVLQEPQGNAQQPRVGDRVTVHYTGWLEDNGVPGHKFDSSVDRGAPFSFAVGVGQVIKGWDEGVLAMKVGEKRRLIIPSDLGYGDHGFPGAIPGSATLIFDVELLEVA